jgi:hypothetical protein
MSQYFSYASDAREFIEAAGPWNHEITGRKHFGEDGLMHRVDCTREFQNTAPEWAYFSQLRPEYMDELMNAIWADETLECPESYNDHF